MKKRDLWTGVFFILAGLGCLAAALLWETPFESLLCGFSGAFAVPGAVQVGKYIKWTNPKNAPLYQERLEQERIELRDERKAMLRDRSGRYAYILGLLAVALAMLVFAVLDALEVIGEDAAQLVILSLAGYALFQLVAGQVIYRLLEKRY